MRKVLVFAMAMSIIMSHRIVAKENINPINISLEAQVACYEYGEIYDICPELLIAIVEAESSGNPKAENGDCKGLMQISGDGIQCAWQKSEQMIFGAKRTIFISVQITFMNCLTGMKMWHWS